MCILFFALSDFSFVDFRSVLWYCWLGLLTCKNRLPYNLYCVGRDVKHCKIQSWKLHTSPQHRPRTETLSPKGVHKVAGTAFSASVCFQYSCLLHSIVLFAFCSLPLFFVPLCQLYTVLLQHAVWVIKSVKEECIASSSREAHLGATCQYLPYSLRQCYLLPGTPELNMLQLNPSQATWY